MKLLAKALIITLVMGPIGSALAKESTKLEAKVTFKKLDEGKVELVYISKDKENLIVQIYNQKDQKIFKEVIQNTKGFKKPYNLRELPYGQYKFEVLVNQEKVVYEVEHARPEYPGNVKVLLDQKEDHKFKFMVMGPKPKDFTLKVFDDNNQLLLEEAIKTEDNFGKVYNFKGIRSNNIQFVLLGKDQVIHSRNVKL